MYFGIGIGIGIGWKVSVSVSVSKFGIANSLNDYITLSDKFGDDLIFSLELLP